MAVLHDDMAEEVRPRTCPKMGTKAAAQREGGINCWQGVEILLERR
jgi:hypothetical protein